MKQAVALQRPNMFNFFIGTIVAVIFKTFLKQRIPSRVGRYSLVKEIKRNDGAHNIAVGIYEKNGKKYFIKTWQGKMKDIYYYYLRNEYINTIYLGKIFRETKVTKSVNVPAVISFHETEKMTSIIFEYIEGKTVTELSLEQQSNVFVKIFTALQKASTLLNTKENVMLDHKGLPYYVCLSSVITLLQAVFHPLLVRSTVSTYVRLLHSLSHSDGSNLVLAHRDLTPDNIIVKKSIIYLVDCENLVMTLADYDAAFIMSNPEYTKLAKQLQKKIVYHANFFTTYIPFHLSLENSLYAKKYI